MCHTTPERNLSSRVRWRQRTAHTWVLGTDFAFLNGVLVGVVILSATRSNGDYARCMREREWLVHMVALKDETPK